MIPILSISNLVTFIIALLITFYLWRAYQKKKEERLKYFLYFFISMSMFFFFIASPFLIFKNISLITLTLVIIPSFLYLSLIFITSVSLRLLNWQKLEKAYLILISLALIFSYLMIFINFDLVEIGYKGKFIYWFVPASRIFWQIGSITNGVVAGITLFSVAIFFFISGFRSQESFIKKRAFLMGSGIFFLTLASVINFIVAMAPILSAHIFASLFAVLGLLTLFAGIVIVKPKESQISKIKSQNHI